MTTTTQPTDVQAEIIRQVRDQLGGTLNMSDGAGGTRTLNVPIRGVTFVLDTDENAVNVSVGRRRIVHIVFNAGADLYNVKISDLTRGGFGVLAEREIEGVYFDMLGELIRSPRLKGAPPVEAEDMERAADERAHYGDARESLELRERAKALRAEGC